VLFVTLVSGNRITGLVENRWLCGVVLRSLSC